MITITEIESAIRDLPPAEFWKLAEWFDEVREDAWGKQMKADAEAGNLDFLFEEAEAARNVGTSKPWPAQARNRPLLRDFGLF